MTLKVRYLYYVSLSVTTNQHMKVKQELSGTVCVFMWCVCVCTHICTYVVCRQVEGKGLCVYWLSLS